MQVTLKAFLLAVGIIIALLLITGIIVWKQPEYGCYPDNTSKFEWKEKVEIFKFGSFRVYAYPLIKDCPVENRYDPAKAINSIDTQRIEQ